MGYLREIDPVWRKGNTITTAIENDFQPKVYNKYQFFDIEYAQEIL